MPVSSYFWNVAKSGNWTTKSNWLTDTAPGANSDVTISFSPGAAYTSTVNETITIASLTIGNVDATVDVKGANTLTVTGAIANDGTLGIATGSAVTFSSLANSGVVDLTGGSATGGSVDNTGFIEGKGSLTGSFSGNGIVEAVGGTLNLQSSTASATPFEIGNKATLDIAGASVGSSTVQFTGATGLLQVGPTFAGTVDNMSVGASATAGTTIIDVEGETQSLASAKLSGSSIVLYNGSNQQVGSIALGNSFPDGDRAVLKADSVNGGYDVFLTSASACYVAGTAIATPDGERVVEDLSEGDLVIVLTDDGPTAQPIRWIGQRWLNLNNGEEPDPSSPVRVRRDAIAPDVPHRDLLLSPDHCLKLDRKLVPALMLVNDMTIVREDRGTSVQYFHVELDRHGILLAEGAEAESYLDTGNRAMFANAGLALMLRPDFRIDQSLRNWQDACAPLEVDPPKVRPVWQALADRAEALGYAPRQVATMTEPDLHAVVAGQSLEPIEHTAGRYRFVLPRGTDRVVLTSRATKPADIERYLDDRRRLGVAVGTVTLTEGDDVTVFPADHLPAGTGWHAAEATSAAVWCWTNGAGELRLRPLRQNAVLDIQLAGAARYIVGETPARLAA